MAKYKCTICGEIYDEEKEGVKFEDLPDTWTCPVCGVPKSLFEKIEGDVVPEKKEKKLKNAVIVEKDNPAIERIESKCIDCGACKNACEKLEGIDKQEEKHAICVYCGQCVQACPTGALVPKREAEKLKKAKEDGKICIAYTSPAVRVAIGEEFGMEYGTFAQGKLVSSLKALGFDYVFDVTFGADLTIMEEASEFIERVKENKNLPMFTSCCPAWVRYAEIFYPEILEHISTCKSPIGMQGPMVKKYFAEKNEIDPNKLYTVAITPCTAKKYEITREEIDGTDLVLTTTQIAELLREQKIDFKNLPDTEYDKLLGEGTGAGMIFGNTGGVMEAALRTAYYMLTGEELTVDNIEFNVARGMENVKEATININEIAINIAIVHKMADAKPILEAVKNGTSKYHYIEIMNCEGGCVGGGGQPKTFDGKEIEVKKKRIEALYGKDKVQKIRCSHQNPEIILAYEEYLGKPLSERAEQLLHTTFSDKSEILKENKAEI